MGQASVFKMLDPSRMEQKNESLFGLVEFPFFLLRSRPTFSPSLSASSKGVRRSTVYPQCSTQRLWHANGIGW